MELYFLNNKDREWLLLIPYIAKAIFWLLMILSLIFIAYDQLKADELIDQAIETASTNAGVKFQALYAVCSVESDLRYFVTGDDGMSHGLCQVQYETAKWMGYKGDIQGLYNPITNAKWAGIYLRYCFDRYPDDDYKLAFACYNRGPGWVDKNLNWAHLIPYVSKVQRRMR